MRPLRRLPAFCLPALVASLVVVGCAAGSSGPAAVTEPAIPEETLRGLFQNPAPAAPRPMNAPLAPAHPVVAAWGLHDRAVDTALHTLEREADGSLVARVEARAGSMREASQHPFVYLNLNEGRALPLTDLAALDDVSWEVALRRTTVRVNGADSGTAGLGLRAVPWDLSVDQACAADGPVARDTTLDATGEVRRDAIGQPWTAMHTLNEDNPTGSGSWYLYGADGVQPRTDRAWLLVDSAGAPKVLWRIEGWEDGVWTLRARSVPPCPQAG